MGLPLEIDRVVRTCVVLVAHLNRGANLQQEGQRETG